VTGRPPSTNVSERHAGVLRPQIGSDRFQRPQLGQALAIQKAWPVKGAPWSWSRPTAAQADAAVAAIGDAQGNIVPDRTW